jgi:hypothetical protein
LIGAALLAAVLAGTAAPGMDDIVITAAGKASLPASAKPLGKAKGIAWAAWPAALAADSAVLSAAIRSGPAGGSSALRLAYLDEAGFGRETQGLRAGQIAEAMRKRAAENAQYLFDMSDRLACETGRIGAWINSPAALETHRDGYFTGRFLYGNVEDFASLIQESLRIGSLERELSGRGDCPPPLAENLRKRDPAIALGHLQKAAELSGQPNAGLNRNDALPRILYSRAIFPWLAAKVESRDFVVDKAGNGYLIPQSPDEIAKFPSSLHPLIAYLDPAESARDLRLLTDAQMGKRMAALVARGGITAQDYLTELVDTRLRMLATLRQCLSSAKFPMTPAVRAEAEAAYDRILAEARSAAADLLGPPDPVKASARLAEIRLRIRILGNFAAASNDPGPGKDWNVPLIQWAERADAALEAKP